MSCLRKLVLVMSIWMTVFPVCLVTLDDGLRSMEPAPSPAASQASSDPGACLVVRAPRQWRDCRPGVPITAGRGRRPLLLHAVS